MPSEWTKVPRSFSTHSEGGKPPSRDRVSVRRLYRGRIALDFSENLVTAERADVLTDGNGRIAVRFHEGGDVRPLPRNGHAKMRRVGLRKAAGDLFPPDFRGPVEWTREDDLIVIDTAQFHKPA